MDGKEIKMAMHLVKGYTERIELIALDSGGQSLTAIWADGSGSRAFYAFDDILNWCLETDNTTYSRCLAICKEHRDYDAGFHDSISDFLTDEI